MKQLHAYVTGRVQGVSFRYFTQHTAIRLKLTGWVRNLPDGRVETIAQGPENSLQVFEKFLHSGPSKAAVTEVQTKWSDTDREFTGFEIRWI